MHESRVPPTAAERAHGVLDAPKVVLLVLAQVHREVVALLPVFDHEPGVLGDRVPVERVWVYGRHVLRARCSGGADGHGIFDDTDDVVGECFVEDDGRHVCERFAIDRAPYGARLRL